MLDALFWYTGLIAWVVIVFGWLSMLYIKMREKVQMKKAAKGLDA
jgi:hypothetical protein